MNVSTWVLLAEVTSGDRPPGSATHSGIPKGTLVRFTFKQ